MASPLIRAKVPILGFAAASGTGKTTLLKAIIPRLRNRGVRVGLIKHAHHAFEVDQPGKDSYELRKAGACPVLITSLNRRVILFDHAEPKDPELWEELTFLDTRDLDLILVEGFKREVFPKIELYREGIGAPLQFPEDPSVIAIATDGSLGVLPPIPVLDLNDPEAVCQFIGAHFLPQARHELGL
jgi:molybdopterin-guanine dinucleotide biosynthesis protein B